MSPKEVIERWVEAFNEGNANKLSALYTDEAVNHQVAESVVKGRKNIMEMFEKGRQIKVVLACYRSNL